jgi:hypothetical protein
MLYPSVEPGLAGRTVTSAFAGITPKPDRSLPAQSNIGASNGNRAVASGQSADQLAEQHEQPGRQDAEVQQATATGAAWCRQYSTTDAHGCTQISVVDLQQTDQALTLNVQ